MWDDGPSPAVAPEAAPKAAAPAASANPWDDDLPALDARDFGLPEIEASNIRDQPPTGRTIPPADQPMPAKPAEAPAKEAPAPAAVAAAGPAVRTPAPPASRVPPQVYSEIFKGGIDMRIEPNRTFAEALGGLMVLDYQHASGGRSYWWCAAPANGYASFFGKQGLPDPYYFSRMLQWAGK
jgi:hypothetical protein